MSCFPISRQLQVSIPYDYDYRVKIYLHVPMNKNDLIYNCNQISTYLAAQPGCAIVYNNMPKFKTRFIYLCPNLNGLHNQPQQI